MAEAELQARQALPGVDGAPWRHRVGEVELSAIDRRRILTLACSPAQADARTQDRVQRLNDALGMRVPAIGHSSLAANSTRRLLGVQRDQLWLIDDGSDTASPRLNGIAWATDQSDGWSTLVVTGSAALAVLERLVPLDIARFEPGELGRTVVEHLAAIVLRTDTERFELLTPRSSIASFAHALHTAAVHVAAERPLRPHSPPEY